MKKKAPKKSEFDLVHASVAQIAEIKKDINYLENMLRADETNRRPKIQDKAEFKADIEKKKKVLVVHAPRKYRGASGNKAYARIKDLKKIIIDAMPKQKDYFQKYPKDGDVREHDFERTIQQQIAFQTDPKIKKAVQEYKYVMRRLEPDNPTISNIELLRR